MYKGITIKEPFFEIGPKAYCYGDEMLALAKVADQASEKYDVQIILTPQYTDIPFIAKETKHLLVFAPHMDSLVPGRGLGSVLPEAVKYAGATGVMLNHSEKRVSIAELNKAIKRADEVGLATIVCADTIEEAKAIANLGPNIIVAEQPELIGTGQTSDMDYFKRAIEAVHSVNPDIKVLTAAGISNGEDVYNVIRKGAIATGSSSGIFKAKDPAAMIEEMISAVRRAWDERHK
ncbi:MAG: triose-phosphate isomerase [Caldicoprobacterales bacterium]|jgi:triosephosphate isomerase|nr:triose-phosphate isomerase [Clostridiales bacterium]